MRQSRHTLVRSVPRLLLALCLLASFACFDGIGDLNLDLDFENLTVIVRTSGENLDPDGYELAITGFANIAVNVNDTETVVVSNGEVVVELLGIAANCTVDDNPRTVNVTGPTTVTFSVECT